MSIKYFDYPVGKIDVIGISGKKELGKRKFANMLQTELEDMGNRPIITIGYADEIKHVLISLYSPRLTWWHFENKNEIIPDLKINGKPATARLLLQDFGQYAKDIYSKVWIDRVFNHRISNYIYIIHDVRLRDEAQKIIDNNGIIIRLESGKEDKDNDITETDLDKFKFPIVIDMSKTNIKDDIREIINNINVS